MSRGRAVFLDRDGVLNRAVVRESRPYPPSSVEELELLPGVATACSRLREAGFRLIVVTNQPDVARKKQSVEAVEAIHAAIRAEVPLDDIRSCFHDDGDACSCRKPAPGLLTEAAAAWDVDLASSFMVGDRWRDVEAGRRAGCRTVFIEYGYAETLKSPPDHVAASLEEAAAWILDRAEGRTAVQGEP